MFITPRNIKFNETLSTYLLQLGFFLVLQCHFSSSLNTPHRHSLIVSRDTEGLYHQQIPVPCLPILFLEAIYQEVVCLTAKPISIESAFSEQNVINYLSISTLNATEMLNLNITKNIDSFFTWIDFERYYM